MINKKNMAVAMAAVTVAIPATQSFAAVVDNTQTQEIKAMKEKALKMMNLKFTKNVDLLKNSTVADQSVFNIRLVTPSTPAGEICDNYADFERKFDRAYAKLEDGQSIKISYEYKQKGTDTGNKDNVVGYNLLEDGTVVDFEPEKYSKLDLEAFGKVADSASTDAELKAPGKIAKDGQETAVGQIKVTELNSDGSKKYEVRLSDESSKTNALHRYAEIKEDNFKMNFTKPLVREANDYYLDVDGNSIAEVKDGDKLTFDGINVDLFRAADNHVAKTTLGTPKKVAIDGFCVSTDAGKHAKAPEVIKDVITKQGVQNQTLNASDLFNASENRVTKEGNDLVRKLKELEADLYNTNYTVKSEETSIDKEITIKIFKTEENSNEEAKISEIKIVRDAADTKAEAYRAMREIIKENKFNNKTMVAAGNDRYETAAEVSRMQFAKGSLAKTDDKAIVLVTGAQDKLVDGLTATPLAASLNKDTDTNNVIGAPVLLTGNDKIAKPVLDEINRLGAKTVYIVGGAISKDVEKQLEDVHGLTIERVDGDDRYDTALEVAEKMLEISNKKNGTTDAKAEKAFLVGGKGEADALSAASAAAMNKAPILLTNADKLNKDVKYFLEQNVKTAANKHVYVVGGNNSVSQKAYSDTLDVVGQANIERLSGDNRQDTNAEVVEKFFGETVDLDSVTAEVQSADKVVVAKSDNNGMVDALGAGLYAGLNKAPVLLATNNFTEDQEDYLRDMNIKAGDANKVNKLIVGNGVSSTIAKFIKNLTVK